MCTFSRVAQPYGESMCIRVRSRACDDAKAGYYPEFITVGIDSHINACTYCWNPDSKAWNPREGYRQGYTKDMRLLVCYVSFSQIPSLIYTMSLHSTTTSETPNTTGTLYSLPSALAFFALAERHALWSIHLHAKHSAKRLRGFAWSILSGNVFHGALCTISH